MLSVKFDIRTIDICVKVYERVFRRREVRFLPTRSHP